MKDWECPR